MDIDHDTLIPGMHMPVRDQASRESGGHVVPIYVEIMHAVGTVRAEVAHVDGRMTGLDAQFAAIHERFDRNDERLDRVERRLDRIDDRFQKLDERFQNIDDRFRKLDERSQNIDDRFQKLDERLSLMQVSVTRIYVTAAVVVGLASILAPLIPPILKAALGLG
jgi:predicted nuclease with TOPRIM domain